MRENEVERAPGWYDDGMGQRRWWDGASWTEWIDTTGVAEAISAQRPSVPAAAFIGEVPAAARLEAPAPGSVERRSEGGVGLFAKLLLFGLPGLVVAGGIAVLMIALMTAEKWTVVDMPAHAETSRIEEYFTGAYNVIDTRATPCYLGQPWYECRNSYVDEFNRECVNRNLTTAGYAVCNSFRDQIEWMESVDQPGWTVTSLPSYGYLRSEPETATREVGNGDYRPAITHEATCYLGFVGECPR